MSHFKYLITVLPIILLLSFAPFVSAATDFNLTLPSIYTQVAEDQWYTDEFLINGETCLVEVSLTFHSSSLTEQDAFSEENLTTIEQEAKEANGFSGFVDNPTEITTADHGYRAFRLSFTRQVRGDTYGVVQYYFYSNEQYCVLAFNASNAMFLVSYSDQEIADTIFFQSAFFSANPSSETSQNNGTDQSDSDIILNNIIVIVISVLLGGLVIFLIAQNIYWHYDHGKWGKNAVPSYDASVIDISTKQVLYSKNNAKFKTTVVFSDGYTFITHKTKRKDRVFTYQISVDAELAKEILQLAKLSHDNAVKKLLGTDQAVPQTQDPQATVKSANTVPHTNDQPQQEINVSQDYMTHLKRIAFQYMPDTLSATHLQPLFEMVNGLLDVGPVMTLMQSTTWEQAKIAGKNHAENADEILQQAFGETAFKIDRILESFNQLYITKSISSANEERLLKAFIAADFYAYCLKDEYNINLKKLQESIARELLKRKFSVSAEKESSSTQPSQADKPPVSLVDNNIMISSENFFAWKKENPATPQFELRGVMSLTQKEPTLSLYENGVKTQEYLLQTEGDEDFTGKYFLISVRLGLLGNPAVPVAQIDGFVSDTPEEREITINDVGYRMEGHFLACGGETGKARYEMSRGQDLPMKALKYQGYTTPSNIRLIGICPDCGKSFCFHGYAFYMAQSDVAYSDDGLDCCEIQAYNIDKDTWTYETEGKTFRYYNSFNCPHCGTPYIDYKKHPENKVFGVSGCVFLGKKHYQFK